MGQWLRVSIGMNRACDISDVVDFSTRHTLGDFFWPHTAAINMMTDHKGNWQRSLKMCGAFTQWQQNGTSFKADHYRHLHYKALGEPDLTLLDEETLHLSLLYTDAKLPNCQETMLDWMQETVSLPGWELFVYGNLSIQVETAQASRVCHVFREVELSGRGTSYGPPADLGYTLEPSFCVSFHAYPFQPNYFHTVFWSPSELWLKQGNAFRGAARSTADRNLASFARCVKMQVDQFQDDVEDIAIDVLEGSNWLDEDDRIFAVFKAAAASIHWQ